MGLGGMSISAIRQVSRAYLELVNRARIARGKPRIEPGGVVPYALKLSAVPAFGLLSVSYIVSRFYHNPSLFYFTLPAAIITAFVFPLAIESLSYAVYTKNLKEDLAYFMILEGVSPGDDLLRDLEEESESACIFLQSLCDEFSRLKLFVKFFPGIRGIKEYVLRAPRPMRKLLLEYVIIRESAGFGTWVYSKFQEALRELKTSAKSSLELKTILSLTAVVFNGLAPPLMALVATLSGTETWYSYPIMVIPAAALAISESLTPRLLKVYVKSGRLKYLIAPAALILLLVLLTRTRTLVILAGSLLLGLGAIASVRLASTYLAVLSLPSQLVSLADRVPYAHRPIELVEEGLGALRNYSVFTSLSYHMLLRSLRHGSIDTTRIIAFKDIVEELFSLVKQGTIIRVLVIATALAQPIISSFSMSLIVAVDTMVGSEIAVYFFVSSVFYSVVATLVAFGTFENTILVGLVLLELYALGAVP